MDRGSSGDFFGRTAFLQFHITKELHEPHYFVPKHSFTSDVCRVLCIWRKQKSPTNCNQKRMAREARLAKTLFMITGASLLTWLPFQIMNLLLSLNVIGYFPNYNATLYIVKFLHFSNSLVNVIIYPFRISEFKNVLLQMFHCCVTPFQRENEVAPVNQVRLGHLRPCQELQVPND